MGEEASVTKSSVLPTGVEARTSDGQENKIVVEGQASLSDAMGKSDIRIIDLPNQMAININRFVPAQDLELDFDPLDGVPRMVSIMLLKGGATLKYPHGEYRFTQSRGFNLRYQGAPGTFHLKAGVEVANFTVAAPPEVLARYLEGEVPASLRNMLDPEEKTNAVTPFPVTTEMRRAVSEMIAPGLTGQMERIQMESAALMYITMVARALGEAPPPAQKLNGVERKNVARAYERLLESLQEPPSLSDLAAESRLSEKRLNNAFREIYDGTVFEVLRNARLTQAKSMLELGNEPIKSIAWAVGYNHVSNFNRAFKDMFGVTPGAFSRNR
jgi:AraC-like DNA-binding protein